MGKTRRKGWVSRIRLPGITGLRILAWNQAYTQHKFSGSVCIPECPPSPNKGNSDTTGISGHSLVSVSKDYPPIVKTVLFPLFPSALSLSSALSWHPSAPTQWDITYFPSTSSLPLATGLSHNSQSLSLILSLWFLSLHTEDSFSLESRPPIALSPLHFPSPWKLDFSN